MGRGLESREETPKEGIYGREPAPQQHNAALQQLQARFCRYRGLVDGRNGPGIGGVFIQDEE